MMFLPGTANAIVLLVATTTALSSWKAHGFTFLHHYNSPLNHVVVPTPNRNLVAVAAVDPFGGDQGWDNDDFLDALSSSSSSSSSSSNSSSSGGGGGPDYEKLESANAKYYQKSRPRMAMRKRVIEKRFGNDDDDDNGDKEAVGYKYVPKEDEEEGQGGQMFKNMMERAEELKKNGGAKRPTPAPRAASPDPLSQPQQLTETDPVPQQQQQQIEPPPAVPVGQAVQEPTDPQEYYLMQLQAWQQQVASYAQFAANNPEAAATITIPPPPLPPLQSVTTEPQVPQTQRE